MVDVSEVMGNSIGIRINYLKKTYMDNKPDVMGRCFKRTI